MTALCDSSLKQSCSLLIDPNSFLRASRFAGVLVNPKKDKWKRIVGWMDESREEGTSRANISLT